MKRYLYKIYDDSGNYITTWKDVVSEPNFSVTINGGFSELKVKLARGAYNFGETEDVDYGNQLKLYVFDSDTGDNGQLLYSGYLTRYEPITNGSKETLEVTFLSYWHELNRLMLENSGATEVAYSSQDPSNILKDLLDKFTARDGKLDYDTGTVETTSTTVSYTYNTNTFQEAVKKIVELSPDGWFVRIGADDKVYLKEKNSDADHVFTIGRDITYYKPEKRTENLVNVIYFKGNGTTYKKYTRSGSITNYGEYAKKIVDERVSVTATMDIIAGRILDAYDSPEIRIILRIMDNNGDDKGYDIESIKVGDTCKIMGATQKSNNLWDDMVWDVDAWDYDITNAAAILLQVMKITYFPGYVELEISNNQPDIAKRIEDINRNLVDNLTKDNPSTPTT